MARGKDLSDFERGFIIGARMAGASVTKTAQLASVSIGTVTKVTSAFRSMGKTSVNRVGNCGRQRSPPPSSKHQMREYLLEEWCSIPPVEFQRLVESMPRRIEAVLAARGGPTPY